MVIVNVVVLLVIISIQASSNAQDIYRIPTKQLPSFAAPTSADFGVSNPGNTARVNPGDAAKVNQGNAAKVNPGNAAKANSGDAAKVNQGNAAKVHPGDAARVNQGNAAKVNQGNAARVNPKGDSYVRVAVAADPGAARNVRDAANIPVANTTTTKQLFTFGTLNPEVMQEKLRRPLQYTAAKLEGWQRVFSGGHATIVPKPNSYVIGFLYYYISDEDINKLNEYEGYSPNRRPNENLYNLKQLPQNKILRSRGPYYYDVPHTEEVYYYEINKDYRDFTSKFVAPNDETIKLIFRTLELARRNDDKRPIILDIYGIGNINKIEKKYRKNIGISGYEELFYVFGYGSLNSLVFTKRAYGISENADLPSDIPLMKPTPARLYDWTRCFHGWSSNRGCSPANIRPKTGDYVDGLIFEVNKEELKRIRYSEGYKNFNNVNNVYDERIITKNVFENEQYIVKIIEYLRVRENDQGGFVKDFDVPVYTYTINENRQHGKEFHFSNNNINQTLPRGRDVSNNVSDNAKKYVTEVAKLLKDTETISNVFEIPIYDYALQKRYTYKFRKTSDGVEYISRE